MLRKALDKRIKEDPDYEVFVPLEYYRWSSLLRVKRDPYVYLPGYLVSNKGRVWSTRGKRNKFLKVSISAQGYKQVQISINNKNVTLNLHRILGCLFVPLKDNTVGFDLSKLQINHVDGVKTNIPLENLEWVTQLENNVHAVKEGLTFKRAVKGRVIYGKYKGYEFSLNSGAEGERLGFTKASISCCCTGKLKSHKGVVWVFADQADLEQLPNGLPGNIKETLPDKVRPVFLATNLISKETITMVGERGLEEFGFERSSVYKVLKGNKKTYKGYTFERIAA